MTVTELESLRYPVGRFRFPEASTAKEREERIATIAALPGAVREAATRTPTCGCAWP